MNRKKESIQQEIEILRRQMIESAKTKGYTSCETIQLSQKLDTLINEHLYYKEKSMKR